MSAPARPLGPQISVDVLAALPLFLIAAVMLSKTGDEMRDWVMPRSLNYLLIVLGLILLLKGLVRPGTKVPVIPPLVRGRGWDTAFFMAVAVVYVVAVPVIGFWISSAAALFVLSVALAGQRDLRTYIQAAGTAVGVTVVAYLLMTYVFYVPLPLGAIFG